MARTTEGFYQRGESRRRLPAVRVVEVEALASQAPAGQHLPQLAAFDAGAAQVIGHVGQAQPVEGRVEARHDAVVSELPVHPDTELLARLLELPGPRALKVDPTVMLLERHPGR